MRKYIDLTGKTFGRLIVLERSNKKHSSGLCWKCQCSCGRIKDIPGTCLRRGESKSCGCYNTDVSKERFIKVITGRFKNKNPSWNPNKTDEDRRKERNYRAYKKWRKEIYQRDNYTCRVCNRKDLKIEAHHLQGFTDFPDLRICLDNGITLCINCHKDFHKLYGFKHNTKEQFISFLSAPNRI